MSKIKVTFVETNCKKNGPIKQTLNIIRNMDKEVFEPSLVTVWPEDADNSMIDEYKKLGIHGLIDKMLADLRQIPTVAAAPHHNKVSVGNCPVCGNPVHESKLSFCCADRSCKFALWKESRYLSNMRKTLDKKMAVDLLKKGRTHVKDFYSAKKDKTFAADLVMRVEEGRAQYSLEFPKTPMKEKT